jgi:hypothetical protein
VKQHTTTSPRPQEGDGKFVKLPRHLLANRGLPLGAKVLWATIADRIGSNGRAWPGIRTLANDLGTDVKAILRWLKALETTGLLTIDRRGSGRSNSYQLKSVGESPALATDQRSLFTHKSVGESPTVPADRCRRIAYSGVGESPTEALANRLRNQTDPLNQTQMRTPKDGPVHDNPELPEAGPAEALPLLDLGLPPKIDPAAAITVPARPADLLWDSVCGLFDLKPKTKADRTRCGRVVRDLKTKGATPDELRTRTNRYKAEWPSVECTPEAVCKHWERFARDPPPGAGTNRRLARVASPPGKYAGVGQVVNASPR